MTIGSPSSAFGALTVGAASLSHNERILRRLQFGSAAGSLTAPSWVIRLLFSTPRAPTPMVASTLMS